MDDERYKREVLEPARAAGDQPPEDLRVRYALPDPLTAAGVAARVREVRQCWRRARGQLKYRKLVDRLEAEHRELAPLFAAAERGDLRPLAERLAGGQERSRERRARARARLADAAGMLRAVTPAELEGIARTSGVSRAELESLAASDRIEVREPDALPVTAPYAAYRKVRESLEVLGRRHLAEFVFGGRLRGPMRVLDGFAAPGPGGRPLRLDAEAVASTAEAWARRGRDTSTTHADTVLAALRSGADPVELVLFDVADRLRERLRQRASERALLGYAVEDLGVEPGDARRLVFAVLREAGQGGGGLAGRLRALLDAGEVYAAAELAGAVREGGEQEEARVLAVEARRRVDAALRLREQAVAEADPDRAWLLLADALRLVGDLPGAREAQRRLPPRPVPVLRAEVDGAAVRLSWEPSPSVAGEVGYRVVRCRGRAPRGAGDGEPVEGGRDERPPVNVPLFYGVVAVRGEGVSAPAVAGPVVVRPEPGEVEIVAGDGVVTGRWRCPAEALRVEVVRDGRPVPAGRDGFRESVPNGVAHGYRVSAVYPAAHPGDGGREVVTPGVRVTVTPSAPPEPVYELSAEPDPSDPESLRVRFEPPRHGVAELVLLDRSPPWPRSALVPVEEVRAAGGARVAGTPVPGGLVVRPGGSGWLLAVTVAEGTAAIGAYHRHVHLPPPGRLVAERRGGEVHVGFDWPAEVTEVELVWRAGPEPERREVVTRAAYDTLGGIRVEAPEDLPVEVSVAAAGTVGGAPVTGPPVTARVEAPVLVRYDLERGGPPWRRSLTVRLDCARRVRIRRLLLVRRDGRVMPSRAADGEVVAAWSQVAVPGELSVPLPRDGASGGCWLRCFAEDDVIELRDPPVRRLQVTR